MRAIRGSEIGLVSQNALSALDPSFWIGDQLVEVIRLHQRVGGAEARRIALEALEVVALPDAKRRARGYPPQLSGRQRHRVVPPAPRARPPAPLPADQPSTPLPAP